LILASNFVLYEHFQPQSYNLKEFLEVVFKNMDNNLIACKKLPLPPKKNWKDYFTYYA